MRPSVECVEAWDVQPFDMLDEGVFVRQIDIEMPLMGVTVVVGTCSLACQDADGWCMIGPEWGEMERRALVGQTTVAQGVQPRISGCRGLKHCMDVVRP